jgi:hypothetical protein
MEPTMKSVKVFIFWVAAATCLSVGSTYGADMLLFKKEISDPVSVDDITTLKSLLDKGVINSGTPVEYLEAGDQYYAAKIFPETPLLHCALKHHQHTRAIMLEVLNHPALDLDIKDADGKTVFDFCVESYKGHGWIITDERSILLFIKKMLPDKRIPDPVTECLQFNDMREEALCAFMSKIASGEDLTELAPFLKNSCFELTEQEVLPFIRSKYY